MKNTFRIAGLAISCLFAASCIHVQRGYDPHYERGYDAYDPDCEVNEPAARAYGAPPENYDRRVEMVHVMLGEMDMSDSSFWGDLDEPWSFGIEYATTTKNTGFGPEIGFHFWGDSTGSSSSDQDLSGVEFSAGIRNTWEPGRNRPHPYLGVGGTLLAANFQEPGYDESDGSIGVYAHAGITLPLSPGLDLGLDYRIVRGTEADLPGFVESDYDYDRLALVLGWSF